jgi:hypothetical protein
MIMILNVKKYYLLLQLITATVLCVRNGASLTTEKDIWINNSLNYYNRITRGAEHVQSSPLYLRSAMENYFARGKIKNGKPHHAETIYRRLVDELSRPLKEEEDCDFSNLAVPTLLLALLLQREERYDDARTVFEGFSHVLLTSGKSHKCCCSARVLQAHALFEMKQENPTRAVELIFRAVRMDKTLRPVLQWQQFQRAMEESRPNFKNGYLMQLNP